jgi:hypothetical protein
LFQAPTDIALMLSGASDYLAAVQKK